jgi:hypothetical protein
LSSCYVALVTNPAVIALASSPDTWDTLPALLLYVLYVGPDVFLPLTSAFAAIIGTLLLFWGRTVALAVVVWRVVLRKPKPPETPEASHQVLTEQDGPPVS